MDCDIDFINGSLTSTNAEQSDKCSIKSFTEDLDDLKLVVKDQSRDLKMNCSNSLSLLDAKIETPEIHQLPTSFSCSDCLRGQKPDGSHKCRLCHKNVHLTDGCSIAPESEEKDFGMRRICISCSNDPDLQKKMALTEIENHFGLPLKDELNRNNLETGKKSKRKNLYLG